MFATIVCPLRAVESAWIDYNGHMNMAYYHLVFDEALDLVLDSLGIGPAYVRERQYSLFTVETHVHYLGELALGDPIRVEYRFLDWDDKRLHCYGEMYQGENGRLAATSEQLSLHIDLRMRRAAPFPEDVVRLLAAVMDEHSALPRPDRVGHVMGIAREKSRLNATR